MEWQENYMDRLNKEYIEILNGNEDASEKFWKLEERIRKDKKHPGVMLELNKRNMIYDIVTLIRNNVIRIESLEGFSEELKEQVQFLLQRH